MKKIVSICLAIMLLLALSVTVYAAVPTVSCAGQQKECFVDDDNDGVCDKRAACIADGTCTGSGCGRNGEYQKNKCFVDANNDGICDNRGTCDNPGQGRQGGCGMGRGCGRRSQ